MPLMCPSSFSIIFVFVLGEAGAVIEPASQPADHERLGDHERQGREHGGTMSIFRDLVI